MFPTFVSVSDYQIERELILIQIRKTMAIKGIALEEVAGGPALSAKVELSRVVVPDNLFLKYYDVHTRQGWNGIGPQPDWLRQVILGQGRASRDLAKSAQAKMYDLLFHKKMPGHVRVA